ncbi:MAG TPA: hypothetical protein OIM63_01630 [Bacilli bacterium]|nr:hypothetical protein [Bacilli bacterium]
MNKSIGVYLTDSFIYLYYKDKVIVKEVQDNAVSNNRIAKPDSFYKQFNKIIKENKLADSLVSKTIYFMDLPNYLESDHQLILSIFDKLSFNKIKFIKYSDVITTNLLNINKTNAYLSINSKLIFINNSIFKDNLLSILKNYLTDIDELFLVGDYNDLIKLGALIEQNFHIKTFIYSEQEQFIIKQITKIIS